MEEIKNNKDTGMREETKNIIKKMMDSGFKRNEFSCKAEIVKGCINDIKIRVNDSKKISEKETAILENDLGIYRVITESGNIHQRIKAYDYNGRVEINDG